MLREGYAYVGYTLNINKPEQDPKFPPNDLPEDIKRYEGIVNFEFIPNGCPAHTTGRLSPVRRSAFPSSATHTHPPDCSVSI